MSTQAKTLEQLISELHTTNGDLVTSNNELTNTVVGKMGDINNALSNAQSSVADAVATADTRISDAIRTFAESHADMRINYYDNQMHSKQAMIDDGKLVVDPNDASRSKWFVVPTTSRGYHTYPNESGLTKIHTTRCHSYAPGHSESPEQYQNDWSITYMQFVLANDAATSEQIDQRLAERNINMLTDNRVGGWWDGSAVRTIHNVKIRDLHPYTRLHARFVNKTFRGTAEPQSILEFGGNCTFAIDRVVNHPRIPN